MVPASYESNGITYKVELITAVSEAIADATTALVEVVTSIDIDYVERMKVAVMQKLAYRVTRDGVSVAFAYNIFDEGEYQGCSIHSTGDPVATVLLFKAMFEVSDWYKIKIMPHDGLLKYFVSIATAASIREYHTKGLPLVVVKKDIVIAGEKAFRYLGIKEV